jgi:hypothetical protein
VKGYEVEKEGRNIEDCLCLDEYHRGYKRLRRGIR